jgi:porin
VRNNLSAQFLPAGQGGWKAEQGIELNALLDVLPMVLFQPVVQYYANVGGRMGHAVILGFRTKVEF